MTEGLGNDDVKEQRKILLSKLLRVAVERVKNDSWNVEQLQKAADGLLQESIEKGLIDPEVEESPAPRR